MPQEKRMFIEKILVENFKSYKGSHVIGPFGKMFNTIVGPNGSGKSNVIDAILFVLGFKAKRLRHSRAEDLIYSGSVSSDSAEVTICLIDQLGAPYTISRKVNRKGKSTYALNGSVVGLERISDILKEHNVDIVNNRFMILQGEIEAISNMKPKGSGETQGLVEYLEEIIGTGVYIEKIKEKAQEAEEYTEIAAKARAEYLFVEKEVEYLAPKAEEAKKEIGRYTGYLGKREKEVEKALISLRKDKEEREKKICDLEEENRIIKEEVKEKKELLKAEDAKHEDKRKKTREKECLYLQAKREYEQVDLAYKRNQEMKQIYEKEVQFLEEEIERITQQRKRAEEEKKECKEEEEGNTQQIESTREEREELTKELDALEKKVSKKQKALKEQAEQELVKKMKETKEMKDVLRRAKRDKEVLEEEEKRVKASLEELPKEKEKLKELQKSFSEEKALKTKEKLDEIRKAREETLSEYTRRESSLRDIEKELDTNRTSDALSSLLKVEGYFGRVRELGTIPDKYILALSGVAKGGLNNLVVNTTSTAEKCLDIIKTKRLGRHTIIILDRINRDIKPSKELNRLVDKIKAKAQFLPCFYHLIGDTLVVNNIDAAMKRAFASDRPRVVTLDGKVIEKSGLMSGGQVRPIKLSQKKPLSELQKELLHAKSQVEEVQIGLQAIDAALEKQERKEKANREAKHLLLQAEKRLKDLQEKEQLLKKEQHTIEKNHIKKKKLQEEIKRVTEAVSALTEEEEVLEEAQKKVEKEIEDTMGSNYRSRKALLNGLNEQVFTLQERNILLKRKAKDPLPSSEQQEKKLREAKNKLSSLALTSPEEEEKKLAQIERELREARGESEEKEEKRAELLRTLEVLQEQEMKVEKDLEEATVIEAKSKRETETFIKEQLILTDKKNILATKLGKYKENFAENQESEKTPEDINQLIEQYITYQEKAEHLEEEKQRLSKKEKSEKTLREELLSLKEQRASQFLAGLKRINQQIKEIYSMLTFGGNAEIEPVDYLDPFSEGVIMSVMPPRKSWKSISHLSGGERTLSSLSLIFALHEYLPNSFYVMDEIDAALDYKNVGIVGRYIKEKAQECQFLVISLRENMYELADVFIGVYKPDDTTLSLAISTENLPVKS
ncbi:structural maintenance of chromosome 4 [Nematocida sp. LUAm3]|nr:structural maintenance of chromosome 4 [Nematocida sp. LUAm3]KAI5174044.1 structural maintenance of chromosome 4 [Nematocida sp. LUAm2]KAI5177213.1 structural maintenance of chromosome 4 [Nematocida sp. LUAm1]